MIFDNGNLLKITGDLDYLNYVLQKTKEKCPLGSGALAGNPFKVDRESIAKKVSG